MFIFRLSLMTVFQLVPLAAFAQNPHPPLVEVTRGMFQNPVGGQLFDQAENPFSGSLTGPSIAKTRENLSRIPGSVDLVPAEEYKNAYTVNLHDMLAATPGVFVQPRFGEEARLSIRGSGLGRGFHLRGVTLLQDGIPINLADGSGDFQEIDPLATRAIEVYKGSNGLNYGASTLGGVIQAISPTGYTAPERNQLRFETGSFGTYRIHASAARIAGNTDAYAAVTGLTSEGYRDQSAQEKARFNGNIGYRLSPFAETRFYLNYNNLNQEVPGTLSLRDALDSPRNAPAINTLNDYARDIQSVRLANKTSFVFGDKTLDIGVYGAFKDLFHPIFQIVDQESQTYGGFSRLKGVYQLGGHHNEYTLGFTGQMGKTDALQFINNRGSRGVKTADSDQNASEFDLYAENAFYLRHDLALITGAQGFYAGRDYTNNMTPSLNDAASFTAINPKLGTVWDIRPDAQLFANISKSSEAPTFSELVQSPVPGFVPLDLQRAWTAEIGTRGTHNLLSWDMTAYRSLITGELLNFTTNANIPAATFNAGDTVHQGLELGLDWDIGKVMAFLPPHDTLIMRHIYNLNDFRFNDDPQYGDNRIAGAPTHQYRGELRYGHGDWSVTPNIEIVPQGGFIDYANTFCAPGYAVFGMDARFTVKEGVAFFIDGRNLLDKRYVSNYSTITNAATTATNVFYPGEGRGVFGGLRISF